MSLLILNSSSKIAQGLVKHFYNQGKFEKVVCADLYPNYQSIKEFCDLKHQLTPSKTLISDTKIETKQDLHELISRSSHVLHVTHDYYENVTPKQNVLKTSATIAKELKVKSFMSVNPVEHRHQYDPEIQEVDLKQIDSNFRQIFCDLTFGQHSSVINKLAFYLTNKLPFDFKPSSCQVNPIHYQDLNTFVENQWELEQNYETIKGKQSISWTKILSILEQNTGMARTQSGLVDQIVSPLGNGVFNQFVHSGEKRNLLQFLSNYKSVDGEAIGTVQFEDFYAKEKVQTQKDLSFVEKFIY